MCMSSKTMANVRRVGGPATFVATRASDGDERTVSGDSSPGTTASTASNAAIACGRPSSFTTKSSRVRPETGLPSGPRTTTSTVTSSACAAKRGGG